MKERIMKAYVLIECKPQTSKRIVQELITLDGVIDADSMWGMYEIIAQVEVVDLDALDGLVCDQIKAIDGIVNTMTQIAKKK